MFRWKFAKFLMPFSKPQVIFSWNFAWLFSVTKYNASLLFLGQALYTLHKRDQSKCKFVKTFSTRIKIHLILVIFVTKISFSSNFASPFGINISSIPFLVETTYTFSKSSLTKDKFGEISPEQSKAWNFALRWAPFL